MAELVFDCIGARPERYAVVPSFSLALRISETTGQQVDAIALRAQLRIEPFRRGYSDAEARLFAGNAADSPVVRLSLHADANPMDAPARLARIYQPYVRDPGGTPGPFGLTQYGFAENSGYEGQDLFAGEKDGKLMLFLCEQPSQDLSSPNCLATDQPLGKSVTLSWRFKRAYLARWRELSSGVDSLMARFQSGHAD